MIEIYGMLSCPDTTYVLGQVIGNPEFHFVDIGKEIYNLKLFLRLREKNPIFDEVKKEGGVGIPCFVKADGCVTLTPEDVGLHSRPVCHPEACACKA